MGHNETDKLEVAIYHRRTSTLNMGRELLEEAGLNVVPCSNCDQVFGAIITSKPQILVIEFNRYRDWLYNGEILLHSLNRNPQIMKGLNIGLVHVTDLSASECQRLIQLGVKDFLRQPFEIESYVRFVRELMLPMPRLVSIKA